MPAASLSLKARALKALAAREHSRVELARKLAPHAETPEAVEALLDTLEARGLLSAERFVESLVRRRGAKLGTARLRQELGAHRLDAELVGKAIAELQRSEPERALEVWQRRFGQPPRDAQERARQARFLAQRGFGGELVAQVLRRVAQAGGGEPAGADRDDPAFDPSR